MIRVLSVLLATVSLFLVAVAPALADQNVVHYTISFYEESSMSLDEGEECVGYSGTIVERRTYDIKVTEFVDGPQEGQVHLTGVIWGEFTITPDPGVEGPVYEGSYREKVTGIGPSLDDPRVVSFILPASATGSDGSTLRFLLHGHFVADENGEPKVEVFKFNCIQSATQ